jgi:hypothetical protein
VSNFAKAYSVAMVVAKVNTIVENSNEKYCHVFLTEVGEFKTKFSNPLDLDYLEAVGVKTSMDYCQTLKVNFLSSLQQNQSYSITKYVIEYKNDFCFSDDELCLGE